MRDGKTRSDAPSADAPCICWKLESCQSWQWADRSRKGVVALSTYKRLLYNSIQLVRALVRSTMMQQLVNTWLRQSELGINAVRFSFT